jgi:hypothetical protein
VKSEYPEVRRFLADESRNARAHLCGGLVRKRQGKDRPRGNVALTDDIGNAVGYGAGFSRTGAGKNEQRAVEGRHRIALARIEVL